MTSSSQRTKIFMANQYLPSYSLLSISSLVIVTILLQGPILTIAQPAANPSMISFDKMRWNSTKFPIDHQNELDYNSEIYDDEDDVGGVPSSSSSKPILPSKIPTNLTAGLPARVDEAENGDYDEKDSDLNDDNLDGETTDDDDAHISDETLSDNHPENDPAIIHSNNKKPSNVPPPSRIPFVPSNLWRDLFSKPGILVGIIGGVVIGMLSAILLVMFIIYRMRKKDEGSYALEEGPRKSPSHAYTRVSSREFFA